MLSWNPTHRTENRHWSYGVRAWLWSVLALWKGLFSLPLSVSESYERISGVSGIFEGLRPIGGLRLDEGPQAGSGAAEEPSSQWWRWSHTGTYACVGWGKPPGLVWVEEAGAFSPRWRPPSSYCPLCLEHKGLAKTRGRTRGLDY